MTINRTLEGTLFVRPAVLPPSTSRSFALCVWRAVVADVARKNRLISGMKRQLRASGQQVAPLADLEDDDDSRGSERGSTDVRADGKRGVVDGWSRKARNNSHRHTRSKAEANGEASASDEDEDEDDISAFLLATRAHSTRLTRLNDHVQTLITRGREAVGRVATMQEGGRGKVWGVLELGERDAREGVEEGEENDHTPEGQVVVDDHHGAAERGNGAVEFVDGEMRPVGYPGLDGVDSDLDSDSVRDRGAVD